jgi:hypothetical protein
MDARTCLYRHGIDHVHHRFVSMGESPTQYLDDKTKEKALAEEMKKTYGTERGSCVES